MREDILIINVFGSREEGREWKIKLNYFFIHIILQEFRNFKIIHYK
jgi:hypothetical protein